MSLKQKRSPRVDSLLQLSVVKIVEGQYYGEYIASEDDNTPLYGESYMEWAGDWFDLSTIRPIRELGDFVSTEKGVKAIKSGWIITGHKTIGGVYDEGWTNMVDFEIEQVGLVEFLEPFEVEQYFSDDDLQVVTLAFTASCTTDWETGYPECEADIIGKFDYQTGEIV